ncbi:MAG TPA: GNAT family N-acetyltransferase [Thermoleophilaceae bacterium]|jgi:acetyltransferase
MLARLQDGLRVVIREIRPSDRDLLEHSRGRFSDESMRRRFLGPKPRLTSTELRYLTEVDGEDHYAIVAVPLADLGAIVAVARFVRQPGDPATAEAAIIVADELQGRGLGKRMAHQLADAARDRGIRRFTASMLTDNRPALALMRTLSERLDSHYEEGHREVVSELAA